MMAILREKSSQDRAIHSLVLREENGVPHETTSFEGVLELNRQVCLISRRRK